MIIPIGHDRQKTQRAPVVTYALVALNIFFFAVSMMFDSSQEQEILTALHNVMDYVVEHEQVVVSEKVEDLVVRLSGEESFRDEMQQRRLQFKEAYGNPALLLEQPEVEMLASRLTRAWDNYWVIKYGFVPGRHLFSFFNYLSCIFLHGGLMHLAGNMLYLLLAGIAIEDLWGRAVYPVFYLLSGVAATLAHYVFDPHSETPVIGASGAIAGLMGAFMVRHFHARVKFWYAFFFFLRRGTFHIPAYVVLPLWLLQQLFFATVTTQMSISAGVAFWAHIGGFAFGAAFAAVLHHGGIESRYLTPGIEALVSFDKSHVVNEALDNLNNGDAAAALPRLQMRLQARPDDVNTMYALAQAYYQLGHRPEMVALFHQMIRLHLKAGNREAALDAYGTLLETYAEGERKDPLPAREWMILCDFLKEQNRLEEAAGEYEKLANAYPDQPFAAKALISAAELQLQHLNEREHARDLFHRAAGMHIASSAWRSRIAAGLVQIDNSRSTAKLINNFQFPSQDEPPKPEQQA
jgi:membrane associated rhomboid family serine protease